MLNAPEPFSDVFLDERVDEVLVDGSGTMNVLRDGKTSTRPSPFATREVFADWLFELALCNGVRLDPMRPASGGSLKGAYRWHAMLSPVAVDGPLLALRRHRFGSLTSLAAFPDLAEMQALLQSFKQGRPLVIAGPTGSGKTSLLAALLREHASQERVVILETLEELPQASPHWVRLVERAPNLDGKGGVNLTRLFQESLRLRPDRLVIGEVRGIEARVFAEAALSGHRGVVTTMHAQSRAQVLARLRVLSPPELVSELEADLEVVVLARRQA